MCRLTMRKESGDIASLAHHYRYLIRNVCIHRAFETEAIFDTPYLHIACPANSRELITVDPGWVV